MVVDTSALVAILLGEPDAERFARALGDAPVRLLSAVTPVELSFVIEGRKGETGRMDVELLLRDGGFDIVSGELELGDLLADRTQGLTDPDDAPPAPEHPVSRTGDLWLLGRHRLLFIGTGRAYRHRYVPTHEAAQSGPGNLSRSKPRRCAPPAQSPDRVALASPAVPDPW
jgi:hypothetical protein